ncbi:MAG: tRNA preQ1(34) S-adenosylmethionine ribosyltransferase-isomerase QueA [Pseudomonadota bacterium]
MRLSEFDFDLPEGLIATRPMVPRRSAKLLHAENGQVVDRLVEDLPNLLRPGDLLVVNNTKVLPARLFGSRARLIGKETVTAGISVTLLSPTPEGDWRALLKPLKKVALGEVIAFGNGLEAEMRGREDGQAVLRFNLQGASFDEALEIVGSMPLPPYIEALRPADAQDNTDYQPIFAREKGAVAAPTASLHFDLLLLDALKSRGVARTEVTLHVGAGTFLPVKTDDISEHKMHAEWGRVSEIAADQIARTKASGGRVIAVGTTALRLLETAARETGVVQPWVGDTDIFITPGFDFRAVDGLMTNFHLPKSTLMMLVSALMGRAEILEIYRHAVAKKYRFFSYGDASLLIP